MTSTRISVLGGSLCDENENAVIVEGVDSDEFENEQTGAVLAG